MKTRSTSFFTGVLTTCLALNAASFAQAAPNERRVESANSPAELEVHEWGTFTVLQGSDGQVIEWYQAPDQLVDLPPFVRSAIRVAGKSGTGFGRLDTVRMETPVLYFYPEEEMDVTVSASFPNGRITEIFPPAAKPPLNGETIWHGTLLAPDSPERKKVPAATGPSGRHYAAAREVPDAWLFRNKPLPTVFNQPQDLNQLTLQPVMKPSTEPNPPVHLIASFARPVGEAKIPGAVEPIEHFIFYRGAGQHQLYELRATQGEGPDEFTVTNYGKATIPKVFGIRVANGRTSWMGLDSLTVAKPVEGKILNQRSFSFSATSGTTDEIADDLRTAMIDSLHAEGLTSAEATAMVNTWDELWFTEPGTRFLAILPQQFADEMVPLKITPTPKKIDRVFVARVEIITREKEQVLTAILSTDSAGQSIQTAAAQLADLQLGRYAAGGMERALTLLDRQMRSRFAQLSQAVEEALRLPEKTD